MSRTKPFVLTLTVLAFMLGTVAAQSQDRATGQGGPNVDLDDARLIVEFNFTSQDWGIQAFLDGEPWQRMMIFSPDGHKLMDVKGKGDLGMLGLTELFVESHEPDADELPLDEFLALFPEGEYGFVGVTTDGSLQAGAATFTHVLPDAPEIIAPEEDSVQDPNNTVIVWEPVADPPGSSIVEYQVIVEREDVDPKRVFSAFVPATVTSMTVPPEFLAPGVDYVFEVLSIEAGRNQTISESAFSTQD